jgi:hypothetical protein
MKPLYSICKILLLFAPVVLLGGGLLLAQQPLPATPEPTAGTAPPASGTTAADAPASPNGVEVLSRGPIHEAYATPTTEPVPTKPVDKAPPKAIEEMPPAEKPEGNAVWIPGYWAWDDERKDFLWVSGTWRTPPPNKNWVAGYWKEDGAQWHWVPGFWTQANAGADGNHQMTYYPAPPAPPNTAAPGEPPSAESFYVPGQWVWHDSGYVVVNGAQVYREAGYGWVAGYWGRVQPGYVWVAAHYRWTPSGYVYIPGYWDLAIDQRGFLYAPVYVDTAVVGPTFVYTPAYVVPHTVIIDAFWVRPCYCHYYFGDYYGVVYTNYGFESCVVYSRRCYDPIFVYAVYEHRAEPRWVSIQVDVYRGRAEGRYVCPPRTVREQIQVGYRGPGVVASARVTEVTGVRTVRVENRERVEAMHHAEAVRQVAAERSVHEVRPAGGAVTAPRTAAYHLPDHGAAARSVPGAAARPGPGAAAHPGPGAPVHPGPGAAARPMAPPPVRRPPPPPPKREPEKKRPEHERP